ncbi:YebC/PmpR family DNA-binding transcriptional regulator [Bacillus daqingensis]|uniref:Probable transcriptional regulatory protein ACFO4L_16870 n=1 Tax=Bacillus daqingensis TaxID=872396 RepID=A0ABV9NZD6_9BACI
MAGHSKWNNIKHRKGRQDEKRGKLFTKISKEIYQAVRTGGENPETNLALRAALDKAKQVNMPKDNIDRTIKKATGGLDGVDYEHVVYEGYGPAGTAVYVEALTENRNRTAAEIRLAFNKNGGSLGENGCVSFMFARRGRLILEAEQPIDEEELLLLVLEAGGDDMQVSEQTVYIETDPASLDNVRGQMKQLDGITIAEAEAAMIPDVMVELDNDKAEQAAALIEALEDSDDVQHVYHNADFMP